MENGQPSREELLKELQILRARVAALETAQGSHQEAEAQRCRLPARAELMGPLGCWEWDRACDRVTWSDEMVRLFGQEPGQRDWSFESALACAHPDDRSHIRQAVEESLRTGLPFHWQGRIIRPTGEVRVLASVGTVVADTHGKPTRVLGICQDITDHQQLEEQLRQAQKMEAVGRLAGGVAHEFNNLLTVILGYSEMLQQSFTPADPRLAHALEITRAAERAADLTHQLLLCGYRAMVTPCDLRLPALMHEVEGLVRHRLGPAIELVVSCETTGTVRVDPTQIRQVLLNLAANARDAMPSGGRLYLAARDGPLVYEKTGSRSALVPRTDVLVEVRDTGCGMSEAVRAHIFEPFFTTKEVGQGTGLGLATAYAIIRASGGHIEVASTPGQGTTFRIYLPRVPEPAA
jgi:two-component system cell cycle sensor histidine kinase/response regulator CckA